MVCVKELLAKILAGVVFTAIGAIIFGLITVINHYFNNVFTALLLLALFYYSGLLAWSVVENHVNKRKGGAK